MNLFKGSWLAYNIFTFSAEHGVILCTHVLFVSMNKV